MSYGSAKEKGDIGHYNSIGSSIGHNLRNVYHTMGSYGNRAYDKVKDGVYRINNSVDKHYKTAPTHKLSNTKKAAIIGGLSVLGGGVATAISDSIPRNLHRTGTNEVDYGWPLQTEQKISSVTSSSHAFSLQNAGLNFAFWTVLSLGVTYGLFKVGQFLTNRTVNNVNREINGVSD